MIFGTLTTDRLIEGERLIRCRLIIQVRLYTVGACNSEKKKLIPPSALTSPFKAHICKHALNYYRKQTQ